jgi:hypothetical protein
MGSIKPALRRKNNENPAYACVMLRCLAGDIPVNHVLHCIEGIERPIRSAPLIWKTTSSPVPPEQNDRDSRRII